MFQQLSYLYKSPRELGLIYACEYADSFSNFALDYVFVLYLSLCFGMSDVAASWIYGLYGVMALAFGVLLGPLVDNMGVKWSLIVGTATSLAARLALVFVTDALTLFAALLLLLPMGVSLTSNVLKLAVRRYTTSTMRSPAFDCSYIVTNSAALTAAFLLTVTRAMVPDFGLPYRPYLLLACFPGFLQLTLTFFLRDAIIDENTQSLTEFKIIPSPPGEGLFKSITGAVMGVAVFTVGEMIWAPRLLELSVMVSRVGVGCCPAKIHFDALIIRSAMKAAKEPSTVYVECAEPQRSISGRDASHCASGGTVWLYAGGIAKVKQAAGHKVAEGEMCPAV
ncbi:hypothetical protein Emag_003800 [Eimeria magna]